MHFTEVTYDQTKETATMFDFRRWCKPKSKLEGSEPYYAWDALTFAAKHRGQERPSKLPKIVTLPMVDLNIQLAGSPFAGIHAAYLHKIRECWIGICDDANMAGSLCHELVHYLQDLSGELKSDADRAAVIASEIEAHTVQWDYMAQRGTLQDGHLWRSIKTRDAIPSYVSEYYARILDPGRQT